MSALSSQKITMRRVKHDVLCVGLGASALSLAVAYRERDPGADIVFLEAQPKSSWRPIRKLPGQDMGTTFMHDLITTENPRSKFTFVKYLHETGRLVNFTNVGKIKPAGELFEDYLRWVAEKFESQVKWATQVVSIEGGRDGSGVVDEWTITAEDRLAGSKTIISAKRVIVAVGSQSRVPKALGGGGTAVVHASNFQERLQEKLRTVSHGANIAIVGEGQPAVELLEYIQSIRGTHTTTLFTEQPSLQPAASSSFANDTTIKPSLAALKSLPPELRSRASGQSGGAVAPAAQSQLIERIYEIQYNQRVKEADEENLRLQVKPSSKVTNVETAPDGRASVTYLDKVSGEAKTHARDFDLVIAATGYAQREQDRLLRPLGRLLENGTVSVDSNYRVNLRRRGVTNGRGLWLVGSLAPEQYVSSYTMVMLKGGDAAFSIMAERSRRLVDSLLAIQALESLEKEEVEAVQAHL
ncbi:uncharacterized protein HMPREF1541_00535 [Cyphellophora europaea CBS 101466]|uniref:L-ornithine N(5)-monooxygenase n=1 Tax=Cyphellophora europaea (strain CBS 101466) TaxID=1220924 RepID=W2SCA4_CYPE1|nr:uncharacterized protein HMPREF1541_00535 [Cyphellophora europaea CBS 101466]ETN46351.1 hypothetical protein HMPREF1541_00535 [Cyphellophora europaea CBS 101466]